MNQPRGMPHAPLLGTKGSVVAARWDMKRESRRVVDGKKRAPGDGRPTAGGA